ASLNVTILCKRIRRTADRGVPRIVNWNLPEVSQQTILHMLEGPSCSIRNELSCTLKESLSSLLRVLNLNCSACISKLHALKVSEGERIPVSDLLLRPFFGAAADTTSHRLLTKEHTNILSALSYVSEVLTSLRSMPSSIRTG